MFLKGVYSSDMRSMKLGAWTSASKVLEFQDKEFKEVLIKQVEDFLHFLKTNDPPEDVKEVRKLIEKLDIEQ